MSVSFCQSYVYQKSVSKMTHLVSKIINFGYNFLLNDKRGVSIYWLFSFILWGQFWFFVESILSLNSKKTPRKNHTQKERLPITASSSKVWNNVLIQWKTKSFKIDIYLIQCKNYIFFKNSFWKFDYCKQEISWEKQKLYE